MSRGRKPKPPALKLLDGNPGKRKVPELPSVTGAPECPDWLSDEAQAEWARIVPDLDAKSLLDRVDRAALTAYCQAVSILRQAEAEIDEHGIVMLIRDKEIELVTDGTLVCYTKAAVNPAVRIANAAAVTVRSFASEFGLTPVSRSRLPISNGPDEDTAARLLS